MPVVARLSKRFYDELGEDIANELVALLNQVDDSSRKELRELNELNFARFDAKLEQRIAEVNAKIDQRFAEVSARVTAIELVMVTKADLADRFTAQNRFLYLAMAMQFAATLGLWLR